MQPQIRRNARQDALLPTIRSDLRRSALYSSSAALMSRSWNMCRGIIGTKHLNNYLLGTTLPHAASRWLPYMPQQAPSVDFLVVLATLCERLAVCTIFMALIAAKPLLFCTPTEEKREQVSIINGWRYITFKWEGESDTHSYWKTASAQRWLMPRARCRYGQHVEDVKVQW